MVGQFPQAEEQIDQRRVIWEKRRARWRSGSQPPMFLPQNLDSVGDVLLRGNGVSAGVVEGRVRLVTGLSNLPELCAEDILVLSHAEPIHTALFSRVGGLILGLGGVLSHAAVVAREHGLPTVAGVGAGRALLQEGDWVRLDGQVGSVELLHRAHLQ